MGTLPNPPKEPPTKTADLLEWSQRQIVTTTCGFCGASIEAPAPEARAWFAEHRKTAHPELPEPQPRGRRR